MRKFYQLYDARAIHPELSWSHYLLLMLIEDSGERLSLEKRAIKEGISHENLRKLIDKAISRQTGTTGGESEEESIKTGLKRALLELYTYRVLQNFSPNLEKTFPNLDIGFSVKIENASCDTAKLKVGAIVRVVKKGKSYSFETGAKPRELYTYKAYMEKVVDGDTLVVNIDLGFKVFIRQRLRLRGLDAPELGTKPGVTSKKFVESRLKDVKFLVIKTHGSDKYDRYLVDVFYSKGEPDEEAVIQKGSTHHKSQLTFPLNQWCGTGFFE